MVILFLRQPLNSTEHNTFLKMCQNGHFDLEIQSGIVLFNRVV